MEVENIEKAIIEKLKASYDLGEECVSIVAKQIQEEYKDKLKTDNLPNIAPNICAAMRRACKNSANPYKYSCVVRSTPKGNSSKFIIDYYKDKEHYWETLSTYNSKLNADDWYNILDNKELLSDFNIILIKIRERQFEDDNLCEILMTTKYYDWVEEQQVQEIISGKYKLKTMNINAFMFKPEFTKKGKITWSLREEIVHALETFIERKFNCEFYNKEASKYPWILEEMDKAYNTFNSNYSIEQLKNYEGEELLKKMFLGTGSNDNLAHFLEFDQISRNFGSIKGGVVTKYPLYFREQEGKWYRQKQPIELSEAISEATQIRNKLDEMIIYVQNNALESKEDYEKFEIQMSDKSLFNISHMWVMKYLHFSFPDKFAAYYSYDWLYYITKICLNIKPSTYMYGMSGQINLFVKKSGISNRMFGHIAWQIFEGPSYKNDYESINDIPEGEYWPSLSYYAPNLNSEDYKKILIELYDENSAAIDILFKMYDIGGESTCSNLENKFGEKANHYVSILNTFTNKIAKRYKVKKCYDPKDNNLRLFPILFVGRYITENKKRRYSWKMRDALYDAVKQLKNENGLDKENKSMSSSNFKKNMILYGPPGTGKTYNTAKYAIAIIEGKTLEKVDEDYATYKQLMDRYKQYKKDGQIAFTTFHQSYGYEEFIEGIKPNIDEEKSDLEYDVLPGIFKRFCDKARFTQVKQHNELLDINESPNIWKVSLFKTGDNYIRKDCLENGRIRITYDGENQMVEDNYEGEDKIVANAFKNKMQVGDIVVSCYGDKITDAIGVITSDWVKNDDFSEYKLTRNVKWLVKNIREDIYSINNNKRMTLAAVYKLNTKLEDVLAIVEKQSNKEVILTKNDKNYVFIIDEINRGNISKIFGELITLIEESKREGQEEELSAILPYSAKSFTVPNNVYLIGTMNTADRSISHIDTALRRRFNFIEMMPNCRLLKDINIEGINIGNMLNLINERIEVLYDREHTIGHAYMIPLIHKPTMKNLGDIMVNQILPLLQEYFFDDYAKIRYVFGDNNQKDQQLCFIRKNNNDLSSIFGDISDLDIESTTSYAIQYENFYKIDSYKYLQ